MDMKSMEKDNDDDSVIYISDNSIISLGEIRTRSSSIESILLKSTSEEEEDTDDDDTKDVDMIMQEEKFVIKETVEETQEEVVKHYEDKATQTYENEFPTKPTSLTVTTAIASKANVTASTSGCTGAVTSSSNQPSAITSGSVPANITTATSSCIKSTDQTDRNNQNLGSKTQTKDKSPVRSHVVQTKRTYSHTKSYSNYRTQPYRRYNNYNGNYNRNYNGNYNRNYGNNYYNNNGYPNGNYNNSYNHGYNRYATAGYNNNYRYNHFNNVQQYGNQFFTRQFKERLFSGFINLMDYVFDYDYSQDHF